MYESFFGLNRRPFSATPDPNCFLPAEAVQGALDELVVCVETGQGIAVLTAPAGIGKTLLCERLMEELNDRFCKVFLSHSNYPTRRALLQSILYELHRPYTNMSEQELRLELAGVLRSVRQQTPAIVIISDEAHLLGESLLEELRTLTDLAEDGQPLVRLVLIGQLALEEKLASPALQALNQRIRAHVCLEPLTREESIAYVEHRLAWAGGRTGEIISRDALELICQVSDGLPRCLNQLCDHSLLLAYVAEEKPLTSATVREALGDLRQLPLHWNEPLAPAAQDETAYRSALQPEAETCFEIGHPDAAQHWSEPAVEEPSLPVAETGSFEWSREDADDMADAAYAPSSACAWEEAEGAAAEEPPDTRTRGEFDEEYVVDRYAALDAGLDLLSRPNTRDAQLDLADVRRAMPLISQSAGRYDDIESCDPVRQIDEMLPLIDRAIAMDSGRTDSDESGVDSRHPAPPLVSRRWDEAQSGPGTDEEIGAAVMDVCLDTQRAIAERNVRVEQEPACELAWDAAPAAEYDVIEPEAAPRSSATPGGSYAESEAPRTPHLPEKPGRYRQLFSQLRRRQQKQR